MLMFRVQLASTMVLGYTWSLMYVKSCSSLAESGAKFALKPTSSMQKHLQLHAQTCADEFSPEASAAATSSRVQAICQVLMAA